MSEHQTEGRPCRLHPLAYRSDPSDWFSRVKEAPGAVLLDSGRPIATRGRFDILSAWPLETLCPEANEDGAQFFARLRSAQRRLGPADAGELPFAGGLIGLLAYDFGRRLETLPCLATDDLQTPDAVVGLYGWALISDHLAQRSQLVFHPALPADEQQRLIALFDEQSSGTEQAADFHLQGPFRADISAARYDEAIARIQAYIRAGDCYQVNYAQRFQAPFSGDPWHAYRALRATCPTPFAGFMRLPGATLLSLSPERFMKVSRRQVETRPIKGTRPRGSDADADQAHAAALLASEKDRAENLMIVDLLRNDLGRSCRIGSIHVPELFALESYPNVHHLVSCVKGELTDGKDVLDLIAGSFPGGSITGAPKIRAMQIIDELEPTTRSIYCGSLFYLDVRGEFDSSITIRTLLAKGGRLSCWGGGGIVMDSDAQAEYRESITKVKLLLETLEGLNAEG